MAFSLSFDLSVLYVGLMKPELHAASAHSLPNRPSSSLAKPLPPGHCSKRNRPREKADQTRVKQFKQSREVTMLTRRDFASVASCALCSLTGFIATDASAQTPPATNGTPGVTRKILSQTDGPTPGYVTLVVDIEIEPGIMIGRHTHPGIESAYMLDGGFDLPIEGQPTVAFKPGMGVVVPANTPHAGGKNGDKKSHIVSTYIVEKGKPLASPA
jgi:quercetin dioxygenase-like cupin family protein